VVAVQALTCVLYCTTAVGAAGRFLAGYFAAAFLLALGVTQVWRLGSECLRQDHRGRNRISAYQILSALMLVYAGGLCLLFPAAGIVQPDVRTGLGALWSPAVLLSLQALWLVVMVFMGRSTVTRATLSFHVVEASI